MAEEIKHEETSEQKPVDAATSETTPAQTAQDTTATQVPVEDIKHLNIIKDILYGKKEQAGEESVPPVENKPETAKEANADDQHTDVAPPVVEDEKKPEPTVDDDNSNGTPEYSPKLLARAKASGVSDKMLALLKTPEALSEFCDELDAAKTPAEKKAESKSKVQELLEELGDDIDPKYKELLSAIYTNSEEKISKLESKLAETEKQSADRKKSEEDAERERNTQWMDTKFHAVSEQYPEIGKGSIGVIAKDRNAMRVRNKIANRMELLTYECRANDEPVPDKAELFDKAVQDVLGQPKNAKKTEETRQKLEKQQFTYPPTHAESAQPPKSDDERQSELDNTISGMLDKIRRR